SSTHSLSASMARLDGSDGVAQPPMAPGPEAARDVGQPMAKNPVALIIPCHRVLAAGGRSADFPRQAAQRPGSACSRWRAFTCSQRHRHSNLSGFRAALPARTADPGIDEQSLARRLGNSFLLHDFSTWASNRRGAYAYRWVLLRRDPL